jgi:hypothetical protein
MFSYLCAVLAFTVHGCASYTTCSPVELHKPAPVWRYMHALAGTFQCVSRAIKTYRNQAQTMALRERASRNRSSTSARCTMLTVQLTGAHSSKQPRACRACRALTLCYACKPSPRDTAASSAAPGPRFAPRASLACRTADTQHCAAACVQGAGGRPLQHAHGRSCTAAACRTPESRPYEELCRPCISVAAQWDPVLDLCGRSGAPHVAGRRMLNTRKCSSGLCRSGLHACPLLIRRQQPLPPPWIHHATTARFDTVN